MHDVRSLSLTLALLWPLSGCALIGYDLSDNANPTGGGAGSTGNGSHVTPPDAGTSAGTSGSTATGNAGNGSAGGSGTAGTATGGSGGGAGASADAGTPRDAGDRSDGGDAGSNFCEGMPDGTFCDDGVYCQTADTCVGGVCTSHGPKNCDLVAGPCNSGTCSEELDMCLLDPLPNGTPCGLVGQVCAEGMCSDGQDCGGIGSSCDLACPGGVCSFDCALASDCTVGCEADAHCAVDCAGADSCAVTCNSADCAIDCTDAANCNPICAGGLCQIDCRGADNCEQIICAQGATCIAVCDGDQVLEGCDFLICGSGAPQSCPDNVIVCNGECSDWNWRRPGFGWR
jgi:hypothetical protein